MSTAGLNSIDFLTGLSLMCTVAEKIPEHQEHAKLVRISLAFMLEMHSEKENIPAEHEVIPLAKSVKTMLEIKTEKDFNNYIKAAIRLNKLCLKYRSVYTLNHISFKFFRDGSGLERDEILEGLKRFMELSWQYELVSHFEVISIQRCMEALAIEENFIPLF